MLTGWPAQPNGWNLGYSTCEEVRGKRFPLCCGTWKLKSSGLHSKGFKCLGHHTFPTVGYFQFTVAYFVTFFIKLKSQPRWQENYCQFKASLKQNKIEQQQQNNNKRTLKFKDDGRTLGGSTHIHIQFRSYINSLCVCITYKYIHTNTHAHPRRLYISIYIHMYTYISISMQKFGVMYKLTYTHIDRDIFLNLFFG